MKSHYTRWRDSWGKDGPDDSILYEAAGEELDKLEDDLIANLGGYEALALATLGSTKAVPHIKRMMANSPANEKAAYACALIRLTGDNEFIRAITSILCAPDSTHWSDRISAAHYLADCRDPRAFDALEQALHDPEYLVRYNAAWVFSHNSTRHTADQTIVNNVAAYDKDKIDLFAQRLRSKISQNKSMQSGL